MTEASHKVRVLVGTRKGTYLVESDRRRRRWKVGPMAHEGNEVFHVVADPRHPGDIYALVNSNFFGPEIHRSRNYGRTWKEVATPMLPLHEERKFEMNEKEPQAIIPRALQRLWHLEPGPASAPETLYLGGDPHLLFRSTDLAKSWEPLDAINHHPKRDAWSPGFGGAGVHTILVHPRDPNRLYIGMSAVGTFRSDDGGSTFRPVNQGVETPFLPEKFPETGQCVHHVAMDAADPETFYRQDHAGMYVSHDGMESWTRVGRPLGDDFGFCVASPRSAPGRAYFVRLDSRARVTGEGHFQVQEWNDEKRRWRKLLSPKAFPGHFGVQREGIATDDLDPPGIYAGTTTGQLFLSPDAGAHWQKVPFQFPAIHSVSVSSPRVR